MKKKNQKMVDEQAVSTNIQILRSHYDNLYEKHRAIISEFTYSNYSKDIRERILREFHAEVQELVTLCYNDGSYEAKRIINLCKNLESTLECVNAHPEKYAGVPVENILYEHKADENDFDGNAREFGTGHHDSHHEHDHEHHHEDYNTDDCAVPEEEHTHDHEHSNEHNGQTLVNAIGEVIKTVSEELTADDKKLIKIAGLDPREFQTHSAVESFRQSGEYSRIAPMLAGKSRSKH